MDVRRYVKPPSSAKKVSQRSQEAGGAVKAALVKIRVSSWSSMMEIPVKRVWSGQERLAFAASA